MDEELGLPTVTVSAELEPPAWGSFYGPAELEDRLYAADEIEADPASDFFELVASPPREVSALTGVDEIVEEIPPGLRFGSTPEYSISDSTIAQARMRASVEAGRSIDGLMQQGVDAPIATLWNGDGESRWRSLMSGVRSFFRWANAEGEVVSFDRVYQPVQVVAGAVPGLAGASGELSTAFERSRSGGLEVVVAAAGAEFSVTYSISETRTVKLDESPNGGVVVGIGYLLIPLDRQVVLVPMSQGGEALPVVRYLPVRKAADLLGWEARAGAIEDVDSLSLGPPVPLRGTLPQSSSRTKSVAVAGTVSLGWENKESARSIKASLGVSAKAELGISWELPAGEFSLRWSGGPVTGAVVR